MIKAIAAMSLNRTIGINGKLPWHLPEDLKRFKSLTLNQPIVMGRKTWESLPKKPLPDRLNIVISSTPVDGAAWFSSIESLLASHGDFWAIGGASIYKQLMPLVQRLELTLVKQNIDGDAFFPEFEDEFLLICREDFEGYQFKTYSRKP